MESFSQCLSPQLIVVVARSCVLIISALAGVLFIFMGWRLYKDVVVSQTEGEASTSTFSIKMISGGPGVFFALFGMWLLVSLVGQEAKLGSPAQPVRPASLRSNIDQAQHQHIYPYGGRFVRAAGAAEGTACPVQNDCFDIVFFNGQRLDKKSILDALSVGIQDVATAEAHAPNERLSNVSVNRMQAIDILTSIKELSENGQDN